MGNRSYDLGGAHMCQDDSHFNGYKELDPPMKISTSQRDNSKLEAVESTPGIIARCMSSLYRGEGECRGHKH